MTAPLRLLFFSDWRLQPLGLIEALIQSVAPVDLIIYGGDDVARFASAPSVPPLLTVGGRSYTPRSVIDPADAPAVLALAWAQVRDGTPPPAPAEVAAAAGAVGPAGPHHVPAASAGHPLTLGEVFALCHQAAPPHNWLSRLAQYARHGVAGVLGNDCLPADRQLLEAPGVRDLHAAPLVIDGVGFLGVEGGIVGPDGRNAIGHVLHDEAAVRTHLQRSLQRLGAAAPTRLVLVSHTPPAGCRLDTALRFGLARLGSAALSEFIALQHPALVLCGHCHCRGGRSARVGQTLVVNAASDDQNLRATQVALIELGAEPSLRWLDPVLGLDGPDIGPARAATLFAAGITRLEQLREASPALLACIVRWY